MTDAELQNDDLIYVRADPKQNRTTINIRGIRMGRKWGADYFFHWFYMGDIHARFRHIFQHLEQSLERLLAGNSEPARKRFR